MSKANGFLQLRRGVWEHVRDGRMTVTETLAFIYICCEADTRTGIWKGCAKSLSGELGIPERTARDVLEKMEHGDYIRRFAVPGRHACYPILVHKFLITDGEHAGEQLNAIESRSPADLAYFPREQSVERGVQHGVEHSAAQKRKRIENETEKKAAEATSAWAAIGTAKLGTLQFRAKWEFLFAHRNGNSVVEAMERCIVACQEARTSVPRPFYEAKRRVEREEAPSQGTAGQLEYLPAMPPLP